ncbi:Cytochrome-P450 monooxygenase, partial [Teratosphaeria destructans]
TAVFYLVVLPLYYVWLHPLHRYPGPKLYAAYYFPWGYWYRSGYWHEKVLELHQKYGHVVRVAPNELSYNTPDAWEDIYGRSSARPENRRPEWFVSSKLHTIIGAHERDQKRMKTILAPGFSRAALESQEPIIKKHMDAFIRQIENATCGGSQPVNLIHWTNYLTFDIIGDLLFGEDFGCVAGDEDMRSWQRFLIRNLQLIHQLAVCNRIWIFYLALPFSDLWSLLTKFTLRYQVIFKRVEKRLAGDVPTRTDFLELMCNGKRDASMTRMEILSNATLLTFAGSESSANTTASLLFRIAEDATIREKLLRELRTNFNNEDEISSVRAMTLPYLTAVIKEGMRLHPVTPNALWRETPKGGNTVLGDWVPGGTILSIHHRVLYRSEHIFRRPLDFIPERWLRDSDTCGQFASDRKDAFHPFSTGPRMCPAENLGYAEIAVIISRLLWSFDITVAEESIRWTEGLRGWVLWDKKPLWLHLRRRV